MRNVQIHSLYHTHTVLKKLEHLLYFKGLLTLASATRLTRKTVLTKICFHTAVELMCRYSLGFFEGSSNQHSHNPVLNYVQNFLLYHSCGFPFFKALATVYCDVARLTKKETKPRTKNGYFTLQIVTLRYATIVSLWTLLLGCITARDSISSCAGNLTSCKFVQNTCQAMVRGL